MLQSQEYKAFARDIKSGGRQFMRHTGGLLAIILLVATIIAWVCSNNY